MVVSEVSFVLRLIVRHTGLQESLLVGHAKVTSSQSFLQLVATYLPSTYFPSNATNPHYHRDRLSRYALLPWSMRHSKL